MDVRKKERKKCGEQSNVWDLCVYTITALVELHYDLDMVMWSVAPCALDPRIVFVV